MADNDLFLTDFLKESNWVLNPRQSQPFGRGGGQVMIYGVSFWTATFEYRNLTEAAMRALSGWCADRNGAASPFTAWRPSRYRPLNGPSATNSGIGVSGVSVANSYVTMTGLPVPLAIGDMISYKTIGGGYYVGEVTAPASAGTSNVYVKPAPVTPHGTPDPKIVGALGSFKLTGLNAPIETADKVYSMSFAARQVEPK
jgi:hypothetical protein